MIITKNGNGDLTIRNTGFYVKQLQNLMKNTSDKEILEGYDYLTQEDINAVRFMNINDFSEIKQSRLYTHEDMRVAYETDKSVSFNVWIGEYEKGNVVAAEPIIVAPPVIKEKVVDPAAQNLPKESTGERITISPDINGGKPSIRNMRFTVEQMGELLAGGMTHEDILADYDFLEEADIVAVEKYLSDKATVKEVEVKNATEPKVKVPAKKASKK